VFRASHFFLVLVLALFFTMVNGKVQKNGRVYAPTINTQKVQSTWAPIWNEWHDEFAQGPFYGLDQALEWLS
jgi:hypothetical protein